MIFAAGTPNELSALVLPYAFASFCLLRQKLRLAATVVLSILQTVALLLGLQNCSTLSGTSMTIAKFKEIYKVKWIFYPCYVSISIRILT